MSSLHYYWEFSGSAGCQLSLNQQVRPNMQHTRDKTAVCWSYAVLSGLSLMCSTAHTSRRYGHAAYSCGVEVTDTGRLTLSSKRLAVKVHGDEETDYLETHTHLIEILKCIVDKNTWKTLVLWYAPWIPGPLSLSLALSLSLSLSHAYGQQRTCAERRTTPVNGDWSRY